MWDDFINAPWIVQLCCSIAILLVVSVAHWQLIRRSRDMGASKRFPRQMLMLGVTGLALVLLIFVLTEGEFEDERRRNVFAVLGVLISVILGLSSTTFVSNAMAGLLIRLMRNYRAGDFIRVGEQFGKVTEKGLFHTEIQTEDRDLVTLPNLYVVTNPVRVVRSSGTFVSVTLSLGYDVARAKVEDLLKQAAVDAKFVDAFVHVTELGDFSISYRVSGLLKDVSQLRAARSNLRKSILDCLHKAGVEIVSPTFMSQRAIDPHRKILPERAATLPKPKLEDEDEADAMIFDKADEAEAKEGLRLERDETLAKLEEFKKSRGSSEDESEREEIDALIAAAERRVDEIKDELALAEEQEE